MKNRSARLTLWAAFLAGQLVVMGASANIFDKDCSSSNVADLSSVYCTRTKFGISVGAIGTTFALVVVGMKMMTAIAPFVVEGVLALFLCILNGFGVAFLTSAAGPGSPIGNLYYFVSSYLSFFWERLSLELYSSMSPLCDCLSLAVIRLLALTCLSIIVVYFFYLPST